MNSSDIRLQGTGGHEASGSSLWRRPPAFVDLGSARIAYRTIGSGEPLVLLHGWPLSSFSFRRIIPRLSEHFTCYLPDTPGLGETAWTPATDFRFGGQAETLKGFVEKLGLRSYSVLAFDTGATIARQLSLIDGARVRKLVLLNTELPHHRPPWIPLFQYAMRLPGSLTMFRALLRSRAFRRSGMAFGGCFVDLDLLDGEFHQHFVAPLISSPTPLEGVKRYLLGIDWQLVDGLAERHAEIRAPVLLIWGENDPTFPIEQARRMIGQFADCRGLVAVPRARLLVHEEQPARVADEALDFLRS